MQMNDISDICRDVFLVFNKILKQLFIVIEVGVWLETTFGCPKPKEFNTYGYVV